MKRFVLSLLTLLTITVSASAMNYEQARDQALFLTDKMAYELNLTDDQYEAAYEINLDYLMRIDNYDDLYGAYWRQRNLDLSYILLDWQYRAYVDAAYFYRPLYWDGGYWHFGIYARYPHRDYFFFGCPNFVFTYHGGHSWYYNGGRSWYYGRRWDGPRDGGPHPGMRARFNEGRFGGGYRYEPGRRSWGGNGGPQQGRPNMVQINSSGSRSNGNRSFGNLSTSGQNDSPLRTRSFGSQSDNGNRTYNAPSTNGNRSFGTPRQSSTRTTVTRPSSGSFGNRLEPGASSAPSRTFTPQTGSRPFGNHSFGGSSSSSSSAPSRSFGAPPTRSSAPASAPSRSFGGSFGGHSSGGSSFGGGHTSGGSTSGGGGHFGRR